MKKNKAFTLIELMVVVSIIAVLSSISLVALQSARTKALYAKALQFNSSMYQSFGANAYASWSFDDSTNLGKDSSAYNINLTPNGGPTAVSDGVKGGAIRFNKVSNQYLQSADITNAALQGINQTGGTVSLWIRSTEANQNLLIFNGLSGGTRMYVGISSNMVYVTRGNPAVTFNLGKEEVDKWHHVALSWNAGTMIGYYDGVKIDQKLYSGNNNLTRFNMGIHTYVDEAGATITKYYQGDMDEINVYSGVLTDNQIKEIYLAGLESINSKVANK